jgi:hypothetical protein
VTGQPTVTVGEVEMEVAVALRRLVTFETRSVLLMAPIPSLEAGFSPMDCSDDSPANEREKIANDMIIKFVMFFISTFLKDWVIFFMLQKSKTFFKIY